MIRRKRKIYHERSERIFQRKSNQDLRIPATIAQLFELMEEELPEEHPSVALVSEE